MLILKRSTGCVIYELVTLERFSEIYLKNKQTSFEIPQRLIKLMKL